MMFSDAVVLTQDLSTNRDAANAAIDGYKTAGGTALYDALGEALARLKRAEGRRVVVVMSDGRDEDNPGTGPGSVRRLSDVLDALKQTGAVGVSDWTRHQGRRAACCRSLPTSRAVGR